MNELLRNYGNTSCCGWCTTRYKCISFAELCSKKITATAASVWRTRAFCCQFATINRSLDPASMLNRFFFFFCFSCPSNFPPALFGVCRNSAFNGSEMRLGVCVCVCVCVSGCSYTRQLMGGLGGTCCWALCALELLCPRFTTHAGQQTVHKAVRADGSGSQTHACGTRHVYVCVCAQGEILQEKDGLPAVIGTQTPTNTHTHTHTTPKGNWQKLCLPRKDNRGIVWCCGWLGKQAEYVCVCMLSCITVQEVCTAC